MKIALIIIGILGVAYLLYSYLSRNKKDQGETMMIDPNELTPGPIQHDELSKSQLEKIEAIYLAFRDVYSVSLEETIENFQRDMNIDREISLWEKMKDTFEFVIQAKEYSDIEKRKEVFKLILLRSMMSVTEVKENAKSTVISEQEIDYILAEFEKRMKE